jgi:hypothetical protein
MPRVHCKLSIGAENAVRAHARADSTLLLLGWTTAQLSGAHPLTSRTALHCTALHCTALHCTALHCTALYPCCTHPALHHAVLCCNVPALQCTCRSGLLAIMMRVSHVSSDSPRPSPPRLLISARGSTTNNYSGGNSSGSSSGRQHH